MPSANEDVVPTNSAAVPKALTTPDGPAPPAYHVATQAGIIKVEALQRVWGQKSKICLWTGVALVAYVYSLDGETTYQYQAYGTSSFSAHSLLGAIVTAQAIILAVMKPVAAKLSDTMGRAETYSLAVMFYVLGYIVLASCKTIDDYAGGAILYEVGYASVQILQQLVIGDVTSLRWRGLLSNCVSIPFFVNAFVSSNIAEQVINRTGWRWGYGMFAIILPASLAPIVVTLFWAQHRAKKLGVEATNYVGEKDVALVAKEDKSFWHRVWGHLLDLDALGLFLFAAGWACVLLPLTLVNNDQTTWKSHSVIAMLVCGGVILIGFVYFEAKLAPKPLFPLRFFKSPTMLACAFIGFFDFVSFYLQYTYQYSFIYVTHPEWSTKDQGYFAYTQTLCLTLFALIAGFIQAYTRRTKWLLVIGLCIRLIGVGIMIKSRGAHGSIFFLVISQVVQGAGGGIAACSTQLLAQGSVPHQDMSTATAFVLLFAEIGNAVGSAIAAAIWRQRMPGQLESHLSGLLNSTAINDIYGSITTAISYPLDGPIYAGIITSYDDVMKTLLIAATCIAVIPVALSFFVTDMYLSDAHNAVEGEDVAGRPLGEERDEEKGTPDAGSQVEKVPEHEDGAEGVEVA